MPVINRSKSALIVTSLLSAGVLTGCVWRSDYDALQAQNQQLQQQVASQQEQISTYQAQVSRLQGAIKYTVNSDLLFPSGGWQMSQQGQQIIARLATKLAPTQTNKLVVNGYTDNVPIGPALQQQGITSNQDLSQKRAENVMQFLISQGVKPDLISAKGWGEQNPIASNDTLKGRAQNRRVEITIAS
jgi:chemotaxis protein MotB